MVDVVEGVEGKRLGDEEFDVGFDGKGEGIECGDEGGGFEVLVEEGSGEVGGVEDVEVVWEVGVGEVLLDGVVEEGLLFVVDIEVGGDGVVEVLGV